MAEEELPPAAEDASSSESDSEDAEVLYPSEERDFHAQEVYCVAFHPSRPQLTVSGAGDSKAFVTAGEEPLELAYHSDSVIYAGFSACGRYLALGSMDAKISIWTVDAWTEPYAVFDGPEGEVTWAEWHPKGAVIAAGSGDGSNWVWDIRTKTLLAVLYGHEATSHCGHFSPNGRYLYSGAKGVRAWDLKQMGNSQAPCAASFPGLEGETACICLAMREDNAFILAGYSSGVVQGLSLTQPQPLFELSLFEDSVESIAIGVTMPWAAVGGVTGGIKVIDISTGSERTACASPGIVKLIWQEGRILAGCLDGTIREYQASSLQLQRIYKSNPASVLDFAVSGERLLKCGEDGKVFLFTPAAEE